MIEIKAYEPIVGTNVIDELYYLSEKLRGITVENISSTAVGGGVAELLNKIVPFLNQLDVSAKWNIIKGDGRFFTITKKIHKALHGRREEFSAEEYEYFLEVNRSNSKELDLSSDIIFIHDPQPIALVEDRKRTNNKWIWRCHVDLSDANKDIYLFLKDYISNYDACVFSAPAFSKRDIEIPQILISPSIDPLSDKNKDLPQEYINSVCEKYGIDLKRPIITQISRFDYLKDPVGVIEVYKKVKKHNDCQLVLAGGVADDDPEWIKVLDDVKASSMDDPDVHLLLLPHNDLLINALQRASTIILQKSIKEGFALTVSEALWKEKPVIASAVGGIPLQITHKHNGFLTHTIEGTAHYVKQLLNEPEYARQLGKNGKAHVKNNFLITRHIRDYLMLFLSMYHKGNTIYFSS